MWSWICWKIQLYLRYYSITLRLYSVIARNRKSSFTRRCEVGCEVGFRKKGSINIYNHYIIVYILNYKITINPTSQKITLSNIMCIYVILWSWISLSLLLALYTLLAVFLDLWAYFRWIQLHKSICVLGCAFALPTPSIPKRCRYYSESDCVARRPRSHGNVNEDNLCCFRSVPCGCFTVCAHPLATLLRKAPRDARRGTWRLYRRCILRSPNPTPMARANLWEVWRLWD